MKKTLLGRLLMLSLLLLILTPGMTSKASAYSFQSPQAVDTVPGVLGDADPAALQLGNGTLLLAWDSDRLGARNEVFLKSYNGASSSPTSNITWGPANVRNDFPSLSQLLNGTIILIWASNQTGIWNLYYKTYTAGLWTARVQFTNFNCPGCGIIDGDTNPRSVLGLDGTLWVFWERDSPNAACLFGECRQTWYKTLQGNTWSGDIQLTVDSTWNIEPGVTVMNDGSLRVVYAKWLTQAGGNYNVFYKTFNGTVWSLEAQLTNVNTWDTQPEVVQDRNGTLWLFWERSIALSGTIGQDKVFYKMSANGGTTWSSDAQLTFGGDVNNTIDDGEPMAVQGKDRSLWIFYSSDATLNGANFNIYYIKTDPIMQVHNLSISKIQVSPNKIYPWYVVSINVTVANLGDFIETASVNVQAVNTTTINVGSASGPVLEGLSRLFSFSWNFTGTPPARYTIVGSVAPALGETVGASLDNSLRYRTLYILYPGDINKDLKVNSFDLATFLYAYHSRPGYPNWVVAADINRNLYVESFDLATLLANYNKAI